MGFLRPVTIGILLFSVGCGQNEGDSGSEANAVSPRGKVKKSAYPSVVAIGFRSEANPKRISRFCSGSRIEAPPVATVEAPGSKTFYILTAGHCVMGDMHGFAVPLFFPGDELGLFAGSSLGKTAEDYTFFGTVKSISPLPNYFQVRGADNDLAVLKLEMEDYAKLETIVPARLATKPAKFVRAGGYGALQYGFGTAGLFATDANDNLQLIYDRYAVEKAIAGHESVINTRAKRNERKQLIQSIAPGDSGGPVFADDDPSFHGPFLDIVGVNSEIERGTGRQLHTNVIAREATMTKLKIAPSLITYREPNHFLKCDSLHYQFQTAGGADSLPFYIGKREDNDLYAQFPKTLRVTKIKTGETIKMQIAPESYEQNLTFYSLSKAGGYYVQFMGKNEKNLMALVVSTADQTLTPVKCEFR